MFLKSLNDSQLMDRFQKLVRTERKITHLVLECIGEIDRRKIYLQKAHSSLYEFLVKDFGYSPSAALRRIESARLLREVPDVAQKVENGSLNLSQLSKVQQALRTVLKTENKKLDSEEKKKPPLQDRKHHTRKNRIDFGSGTQPNLSTHSKNKNPQRRVCHVDHHPHQRTNGNAQTGQRFYLTFRARERLGQNSDLSCSERTGSKNKMQDKTASFGHIRNFPKSKFFPKG